MELILELPRHSRFFEAYLNDDEVAEGVAKRERELEAERQRTGGQPGRWSPPMSEWDTHARLLKEIRETLVALRDAVIQSAGGKPRRVAPIPEPQTAVDRAKQRLSRDSQFGIIEIFAPHAMSYVDLVRDTEGN